MREKLNANAQAVLEAVQAAENHPTASEVYDAVKQKRPQIGLASVYRILHNLVQQEHIREIRHNDEICRYDGHIERHDHAICTECGALLDVPVAIQLPAEVVKAAAEATGITITSHELRLYGFCPQCSARHTVNTTSCPEL